MPILCKAPVARETFRIAVIQVPRNKICSAGTGLQANASNLWCWGSEPEWIMAEALQIVEATGQHLKALQAGTPAPAFFLEDQNGGLWSSAEFLGQGLRVVNFYLGSRWPYCNAELEALQGILHEIRVLGAQRGWRSRPLKGLLPSGWWENWEWSSPSWRTRGTGWLPRFARPSVFPSRFAIIVDAHTNTDHTRRPEPAERLAALGRLRKGQDAGHPVSLQGTVGYTE